MALTQGDPLPDVTVTQAQKTAAPSWYTDYLSNIAQQGMQAGQQAQFVGATPLQQQAFDLTKSNVGTYAPTLQAAVNLAQQGAGTTAPSVVGQYMDPYTSQVVGEIGRLGQRNIIENLAPGATSGAVGTGQFGSQRGAQVLGRTIRDALADIGGRQSMALSQGYQNAMTAAQTDLARQLAGGQQLGALAGTQQQLGQGDINALATLGAQQQQIQQAQQLFPLQTLGTTSQLIKGYSIPTDVSSTYKGPLPGAYSASPLSQIAGLGTILAAPVGGPTGSAPTIGGTVYDIAAKGVSGAWDWLTKQF